MFEKLKLLFFMSCFWFFQSNAQTITLKGNVKDSLQNPLSYANVIAKPVDVAKNMQFAITEDNGLYKLELSKNREMMRGVFSNSKN